MMAKTMILPAALRYQAEVAAGGRRHQGGRASRRRRADGAAQDADRDDRRVPDGDRRRSNTAVGHHADGDALAHAKHSRDAIIPAMTAVRAAGDKLETIVADDLWPLPTYREMLFIK